MATRSGSTARARARLLPGLALVAASATLVTACGSSSNSAAAPATTTAGASSAGGATTTAASSAPAPASSGTGSAPSAPAPTSAATGGKPVTLTWWHNATNDPGKSYFQGIANEYTKAHPNVTIKILPIQNEQLDTKVALGLES